MIFRMQRHDLPGRVYDRSGSLGAGHHHTQGLNWRHPHRPPHQRKAPTATPASTRRMMRQRRRRRALALNSSPHRANRPMSCFSKSRRVRTCISIRGKRPSPLVLPKPALRPFMLIICPSCDASRASSSASASATSFFCSAMAPSAFPLSASAR